MQNADLITAFIVIAAVAIVIQAGILIAMYLAMRKSTARMEALATEVKSKVIPTAEMVQATLTDLRPKIQTIADNVSQSSTLIRGQMERMDATLNDIIDRTRLQVIRADEMLGRTLDKVEETTEAVHRTVTSPVRKLSGVMAGVAAGLEYFLNGNRRRQRQGVSVPQDEMFI
jgi:DNA anti-recombination protein RmuC